MKKFTSYITNVNIIIVVVLLNVLLSFYPFLKFDLTRGRVHSLSSSTEEYIKTLDDIINIKVFLTEDLPPEAKPTAENLKTILEEFGRLNRSNLRIAYLDPNQNEEAAEEASKLGIQPLQFSSLKSDKFEIQKGYFGLAMIYGDKKQVLPVAGDVGNLEYFLVSGLRKLTEEKVTVVAMAESTEEEGSEVNYLRQFLMRDYSLVKADLDSKEELPDNADILIITGRKTEIDKEMIGKIRKWVDDGKGLIVFNDTVETNESMQGKVLGDIGIEALLKENGIELGKKLVMDGSSAIANFQTENGSFLSQYPYWVQVRPENINGEIPAMSGISSVTLPWVSSINVSGSAKALFTSSQMSKIDESMSNLTPSVKDDFGESESKYTLAAVNTEDRKIAVVADSDFIKDGFLSNNQQNLLLALNLVDYFSQDQSLLSIRSKSITNSPLQTVDDKTKQMVKIGNMITPVVLLVLSGGLVNLRRNKLNRKWYEKENN